MPWIELPRPKYRLHGLKCASDVTDEEWAPTAPMMPALLRLRRQRRTLRDQRIDALLREPLGQLDGGLHRQHRPRFMVDDVTEPVGHLEKPLALAGWS